MSKFSLVLLAAVVAATQGCGSSFEAVPLVPVSGKLSSAKPFDHKGLGVSFISVKGSATGTAIVSADGTFTGEAPLGDCVAFLYGAPQPGGTPGAGHADATKSKINQGFWNAATSPWKVTTVAEGKADIDLSLDIPITAGTSAAHGAR